MLDFDFQQIAPRCGGYREAFEELCCQLAHRTLTDNRSYVRLRGDGGDGGVECFADLPDGTRIGWQAKYVFDIDSLLKQAGKSLETALKVHSTLTHYVVCFPFDLTGPTGKLTKLRKPTTSQQEKLKKWLDKYKNAATSQGRSLDIEIWSESRLRSLILDLDKSGGIREFFFNKTILSQEWFQDHLHKAKHLAGSRYTPELKVKTELWKWFSALGRTNEWIEDFEQKVRLCRQVNSQFSSHFKRDNSNIEQAEGFENCHQKMLDVLDTILSLKETASNIEIAKYREIYEKNCSQLQDLINCLIALETYIRGDLERKYGSQVDSAGFRQWMAEYNLSFPTSNLDFTRDAIKAYQELDNWLKSPEGCLAFSHGLILTGVAGSGKTHGICDVANYRLNNGLLTCITFGHLFGGNPDPWTRMLELLGLPINLGINGFLDLMNTAAEATGSLLLLCIDAVNETRPLRYWKNHLLNIIYEIEKRPYLRLCITCRTAFILSSLPEKHSLPVFEHQGFTGIEHNACNVFFQHYGLEPPITPILQPEFKNPLYLKLLCDTLKNRSLKKIPSGLRGLSPIIQEFLKVKQEQFVEEYGDSVISGANIVCNSLQSIVQAIAKSGESGLSWTQAQNVIKSRINNANLPVMEWLVRADLLIEDAPTSDDDIFGGESFIRPSFERLGDFLVARELLNKVTESQLPELFQVSGSCNYLIKDLAAVAENSGIISALSIIIPEQFPSIELPNLIKEELIRYEVIKCTVSYFVWRDPSSFSESSKSLLCNLLIGDSNEFQLAMDVALSISCQPSIIDAIWLNDFLMQYSLAQRDAAWCGFLHQQYEAEDSVKQLIDAAFKLPLNQVELDISQRWVIILLWFTAASDRRVKDNSTRAASAILAARSEIIPNILLIFFESNDDAVIERALLSCYGALIVSCDIQSLQLTILTIYKVLQKTPERFDNALLRDYIRCIIELAQKLEALPSECDPQIVTSPINSGWPLQFPSDTEVQIWKDNNDNFPKLAHSCLEDDFFIYSMSCLRAWEHSIDRKTMGKWILQEIINNLGYSDFNCNLFDSYILSKYGGGRGRRNWAERIGKKYQWIAMYRLASKLSDNVKRKRDSWEPKSQRIPLILLDERQLDPTLPASVVNKKLDTGVWWIKPQIYPQNSGHLSDAEWVEYQDDLPKMEDLLQVIKHDGQEWRLLSSYPAWGHRDRDNENKPYRQIWIHLRSYLIPEEDSEELYNCLHKRNFFGGWMPEGSSWLYGFAGEYPWATSFNTEPDSWYAHGDHGSLNLSEFYTSSSNQITVEWSNDASLFQSFEMCVPSRIFFESGNLWWNGCDGYRLVNGKTVFRDPSVNQMGSYSLLADNDYLLEKLNDLGLRLIWTLLGEKWILGGKNPSESRPSKTFSQIARLEKDTSIVFGERVFFTDYTQDTDLFIEYDNFNE